MLKELKLVRLTTWLFLSASFGVAVASGLGCVGVKDATKDSMAGQDKHSRHHHNHQLKNPPEDGSLIGGVWHLVSNPNLNIQCVSTHQDTPSFKSGSASGSLSEFFIFTDAEHFSYVKTFFSDKTCEDTRRTVVIRTEGTYAQTTGTYLDPVSGVSEPSAVVNLSFSSIALRIDSEDLIKQANSDTFCGSTDWQTGANAFQMIQGKTCDQNPKLSKLLAPFSSGGTVSSPAQLDWLVTFQKPITDGQILAGGKFSPSGEAVSSEMPFEFKRYNGKTQSAAALQDLDHARFTIPAKH